MTISSVESWSLDIRTDLQNAALPRVLLFQVRQPTQSSGQSASVGNISPFFVATGAAGFGMVGLNHEWTRIGTNECSSGFPARDLPSATGRLLIAAAGRGLRPVGLTRRREGNAGVVLNHEWTRIGTNECSSGFPARDLPSKTGRLLIAAAGRGFASRAPDAKTRRETLRWVFGVRAGSPANA